jgi:ferredoxin
VLDGLEYLRTATLGLPYPDHAGKRVVVIGGGFTSMDCSRTSVRQGAAEVTLVYRRDMKDMPAANEVHEAIEEGVQTIFQAGPVRVVTDDKDNVTGVEFIRMRAGEPDASGRRRPEPAPGTEFTIPCDRVLLAIGQGPELDWLGARHRGRRATKQRRLQADAVTFETGRPACSAPATSGSAPRPSSRPSPRAAGRLRGRRVPAGQRPDAIRTRQTLAEPQPEFLSIVPFTSEVKEPRYRLTAMRPRSATTATSSTSCRTPREAWPNRRAASSARARRSASATCAAWASSTDDAQTLEPNRTRAPATERHREPASPGVNHDYIRDDSHAFILREPSRCIDCGRCANVCAEVVGAAVLRLHAASASTRWSRRRST